MERNGDAMVRDRKRQAVLGSVLIWRPSQTLLNSYRPYWHWEAKVVGRVRTLVPNQSSNGCRRIAKYQRSCWLPASIQYQQRVKHRSLYVRQASTVLEGFKLDYSSFNIVS
jgi:hypothetical protein